MTLSRIHSFKGKKAETRQGDYLPFLMGLREEKVAAQVSRELRDKWEGDRGHQGR